MSGAKFASITAGLLARKGEARPWIQGMAQENELPAWHQLPPVVAPPPVVQAAAIPPSTPPKDRACSIRMSAHDYERLGIIAVKTGSSRSQLLKDALAGFLAAQAKQHGCLCLKAGGETCGC